MALVQVTQQGGTTPSWINTSNIQRIESDGNNTVIFFIQGEMKTMRVNGSASELVQQFSNVMKQYA